MRLHEGSVPDGQHPWRCLFNTDAFYGLRQRTVERSGLYWHGGGFNDALVGEITSSGGESGWSAPYGGVDWTREFWAPEIIDTLLGDLTITTIRCKPGSWGECEAPAVTALLRREWVIGSSELNYWIGLPATIDDYEAGLSRQARHAIDRGEDMGLKVEEFVTDELWRDGYRVLAQNREAKGRLISLSLHYVFAIRDAFPGLIRMLGCHDGHRTVAAALVYRVGRGRDLVQFWGDDPAHGLPYSPMNLLVREVVAHSIQTGAKTLDLGISTEGGVPNGGLCRFKRSIGARAEPRFSLVR